MLVRARRALSQRRLGRRHLRRRCFEQPTEFAQRGDDGEREGFEIRRAVIPATCALTSHARAPAAAARGRGSALERSA
jgi:hypothetical protein